MRRGKVTDGLALLHFEAEMASIFCNSRHNGQPVYRSRDPNRLPLYHPRWRDLDWQDKVAYPFIYLGAFIAVVGTATLAGKVLGWLYAL